MGITKADLTITLEMLGLSPSVEPMHLSCRYARFEFPGYFKKPAQTDIQVYARNKGNRKVVIATEIDENTGVSITNGAESLFNTLCRELNIRPEDLILIEHYRADSVLDEHWSLVRFKSNNQPEWYHLERSELVRLLGVEIDDGISDHEARS